MTEQELQDRMEALLKPYPNLQCQIVSRPYPFKSGSHFQFQLVNKRRIGIPWNALIYHYGDICFDISASIDATKTLESAEPLLQMVFQKAVEVEAAAHSREQEGAKYPDILDKHIQELIAAGHIGAKDADQYKIAC